MRNFAQAMLVAITLWGCSSPAPVENLESAPGSPVAPVSSNTVAELVLRPTLAQRLAGRSPAIMTLGEVHEVVPFPIEPPDYLLKGSRTSRSGLFLNLRQKARATGWWDNLQLRPLGAGTRRRPEVYNH